MKICLGLKEYYSEIRNELNISNNLGLLNPGLINEPALYSLITSKYHLAEASGICFNINISENFKDIAISPYVFSRILGILLDNAIEAAKSSNEKEMCLDISKTFVSKFTKRITVSIRNTYSNKNIDISKIYEKGYTSKTSDTVSHGLGLWEVNKLLKKSDNLNLYTTKNDKFFEQDLEIFDISK